MKRAPKKSGGALSFSPRQSVSRAVLSRLMIAALILIPLIATARGFFGNSGARVPFESSRAANFTFYLSGTTLQTRAAGWLETVFALPLLLVETLRQLADSGWQAPLLHLSIATLILGALWFGIATFFGRRAPFLPLLLLLALQLGGMALLAIRHFAPPLSLSTPYTTFAVARGGNASAEIARLEKSGVNAVALAGNRALSSSELSALRKAHPRVLIASGFAANSDDGARFFVVGAPTRDASTRAKWRTANEAARDIAGRGGAMLLESESVRSTGSVSTSALLLISDAGELRAASTRSAKKAFVAGGTSGVAWTILPRGLKDGDNVARALQLGKTQALFARDVSAPSGLLALPRAARIAWRFAATAQRAAAIFSLIALVSALCLWSANGVARKEATLSGPQRAVGYLRKRRLIVRGGGALALFAALLGSALVTKFAFGFAPATLCWLALSALFFYGYRLWRYSP